MEKKLLTIDFGTGVAQSGIMTLDDAKEMAHDEMTYTQEHVSIYSDDGQLLAISRWYGVLPTEDDDVLETFDDYGFYAEWTDM